MLQVRLNGFVLLVELGQVRHDVFYDVGVREGVDLCFLLCVVGNAAQTSQSINPINVHRTTPTDPLSAAPSESKCRIHLVLDSDQRIQHHGSCLVQIKRVRLHPRLGGRLVGIPAIDVEGLDLGVWRSGRLFDCAGLRRGLWVHDRRHAADAHGGPQRGADCREGAGGEACCHYEGGGEWPDLCLFECEGCERALCSIVGRRDN